MKIGDIPLIGVEQKETSLWHKVILLPVRKYNYGGAF
jgi:hypothetical protein